MSGATTLVAPSGALSASASDDPDYTLKMSFTDTGSDSGYYELDFDATPYIEDERITILCEYGPRTANDVFNLYVGVRAGGEAEVPMAALNSGVGSTKTGIVTGVFNVTTGAVVSSANPFITGDGWSIGGAIHIGIGDAADSPCATGVPMGPFTASVGTWPQWLDPAAPRVGDFVGVKSKLTSTLNKQIGIALKAARTPASAARTVVIRLGASSTGGPFADQYVRLAVVRPDAGQV